MKWYLQWFSYCHQNHPKLVNRLLTLKRQIKFSEKIIHRYLKVLQYHETFSWENFLQTCVLSFRWYNANFIIDGIWNPKQPKISYQNACFLLKCILIIKSLKSSREIYFFQSVPCQNALTFYLNPAQPTVISSFQHKRSS